MISRVQIAALVNAIEDHVDACALTSSAQESRAGEGITSRAAEYERGTREALVKILGEVLNPQADDHG